MAFVTIYKTICSKLIAISKYSAALLILFLCMLPSGVTAQELLTDEKDRDITIVDVELVDANRTNREWLLRYLNLSSLPQTIPQSRLAFYRRKLLTAAVFTGVSVETKPVAPGSNNEQKLIITLNEKWTTIPVIRGAFGGGTPLTVLGVYDTHSFGSLWTLGAESRTYGDAPTGYVAWARAPRWLDGSYVLGIEFWQEFRIRTAYDDTDTEIASFQTNTKKVRGLYLQPLFGFASWQWGLDVKYTDDKIKDRRQKQLNPMLKVIYDDIAIDNVEYDGLRFIAASGPQITSEEKQSSRSELEVFYYHLFPHNFNLAFHTFAGQAKNNALASQYFFGGLDSVRGVPDGAITGNHAVYGNIELRHLTYKWRYAWLQTVGFFDAGAAGQKWQNLDQQSRASLGLGFRVSIPQIYRLVFRFDYAWSVAGAKSSGVTAGLNELFQPYPPL